MTDRWEAFLRRLDPRPSGRCLIGLSGGADSVALTRILLIPRDAGEIAVEAIHVNHGIRGPEADGDEAFVRKLCAESCVPLHTVRLDLAGRTDENTAREARYRAFERILREREIPTLLLAHQREDQAETFLMRLMRGAGPDGLRAMRGREERNGYTILRPMLELSGAELREALKADGIPWREDRTNRDPRYLRNRIRLKLLPEMESIAPGVSGKLARAARMIGEDRDALTERAERLRSENSGEGWIATEILRTEPEAIRSRMLRAWWRENGPELDERELSYEQTRRLESLIAADPGTTVNLPAGWRARKRKGRILLIGSDRKKGEDHDRDRRKDVPGPDEDSGHPGRNRGEGG